MIIYFYKKQVKLLIFLNSFEIDMSLKRVRDNDLNKIIFAFFSKKQKKNNFSWIELLIH